MPSFFQLSPSAHKSKKKKMNHSTSLHHVHFHSISSRASSTDVAHRPNKSSQDGMKRSLRENAASIFYLRCAPVQLHPAHTHQNGSKQKHLKTHRRAPRTPSDRPPVAHRHQIYQRSPFLPLSRPVISSLLSLPHLPTRSLLAHALLRRTEAGKGN